MSARPNPRPIPGLAITLVSGDSPDECALVAARLSGIPTSAEPRKLDFPGVASAEFAVELAQRLAANVGEGITGNTIVVLEADADVVEVALVLEHVLDTQQPRMPIGIRDVVAVTSVREVLASLIDTDADQSSPTQFTDFASPGRLAARLEFASLIVLCDVSDADTSAETELVRALVTRLAPAARVIAVTDVGAARPRSGLLVQNRAHRLGASMGWQQQLAEGAPATGTCDPIGVHVFRDPRPFHPGRLHDTVTTSLVPARVGRIIRSRGFVRLASRPDRVGAWSTAGAILDLDPTTMLSWDPDSPIGQEIVFFGLDLDRDALDATLTACLLNPAEIAAGPDAWSGYADPFPQWAIHHH